LDFQSFLIRPPELSGNYQQRHLVVEQEKCGEKLTQNFAYKISLSYSWGSLISCKILQHGTDDFTSLPKETMLQILIALKKNIGLFQV
jgi:hypothetical protein